MEIQGKYTSAVVMTDQIEQECIDQIQSLCSQKMFQNAKIRIMPDCHAGKGCVVGFTAQIKDRIVPNLIGVDISCSISTYKLNVKEIDFDQLDKIIRMYVPSGMSVRSKVSSLVSRDIADEIYEVCEDIGDINGYNRHLKSIGTLGGGNHFIEVAKDKDNNYWLSVHCGSRNFGKKICEYHQNKAIENYHNNVLNCRDEILQTISPQMRQQWIEEHKNDYSLPDELCYLEGEDLDLYTKHMKVAEKFAKLNHEVIVHEICSHMGWNVIDSIFTHHNYIEFLGNREMIIRKGAISAKKGERVIIPMNMRDGSLIGVGKGNDEWNQSAPHGAGRVLSRSKAKSTLSLEEFKNTMKDVWTSCVSESTLDESPMAYKDMNTILEVVGETIDITDRIIPIYNFKAN